MPMVHFFFFFFSSRRRHTRLTCDWSSDVCSSDLPPTRRATDAAADAAIIGPGDVFAPRTDQRKPSTTPTIGLSPNSTRHFPVSRLLGYTIEIGRASCRERV